MSILESKKESKRLEIIASVFNLILTTPPQQLNQSRKRENFLQLYQGKVFMATHWNFGYSIGKQ